MNGSKGSPANEQVPQGGAVLEPGWDEREAERVREKLLYFAWRKFRLPRDASEDVVQNAITTYLEVRHRYAGEKNQTGILFGIFKNKCLEHIDATVRRRRKLDELTQRREEENARNPALRGAQESAADQVVRGEEFELILETLAELRPEARELFRLMLDEGFSRRDLIRHYRLNKNTLDSRLHLYRKELRALLRAKGIAL